MIREYAVEPECLFQSDGLLHALKDIGSGKGRVLVECPQKGWRKQAEKYFFEAWEAASTEEKTALQQLWQDICFDEHGLVCRPGLKFNVTQHDWFGKLAKEHESRPFDGVYDQHCAANGAVQPPRMSPASIQFNRGPWKTVTQKAIPRRAKEIAECIVPLGRLSNELLFVDPYFSADAKSTRPITLSLQQIVKDGATPTRVEIHTAEYNERDRSRRNMSDTRTKRGDLRLDLPLKLRKFLPDGIKVTVFVWQKKESGDDFHRRFFLTELGGIAFEKGLGEGPKSANETTDVNLLSAELYRTRWPDYQSDSVAFDLAGEIAVQ